ncbi:MAG TPA: hypothetical protein VIW45_12010 [Vicinamibacterales bacterium]|jgi:CheY-like chemotaxis protein
MDELRPQRGPDRRKHPRGGRREEDKAGFTPLVMVIDHDPNRRDVSEAILAKLRFAVAPVESVEKAIAVIRALSPAAIVGPAEDLAKLRAALPLPSTPLIPVTDAMARTDELIQVVRAALRVSPT